MEFILLVLQLRQCPLSIIGYQLVDYVVRMPVIVPYISLGISSRAQRVLSP